MNYERRALAVTPGPSVVDRAAAGERLDHLTGELSITHVDVMLPGTGPAAAVVRTFNPSEASREGPLEGPFGDWRFDLPRITTLTLGADARPSWVVEGEEPDARCTRFGKPHSSNGIDPTDWWSGYQLILPGEVPQELVQRSSNNTRMPQMQDDTGKALSFPILTTSQWQVTCLGATTNGEAGEAFIAVSPRGLKYYFTHLVYEAVAPITGSNGEEIQRQRASMLPTRIVDRHGNTVDFTYSENKLIRMERPGEVVLDIGYSASNPSLISDVVLAAGTPSERRWQYSYESPSSSSSLARVVLPDGSTWEFGLADLLNMPTLPRNTDCGVVVAATSVAGRIQSPSGLKASYVLGPVRHRRGGGGCLESPGAMNTPWYEVAALQERTYEGAGLAPLTWTYAYSGSGGLTVRRPDGAFAAWVHSSAPDASEGKLREQYVSADGSRANALIYTDITYFASGSKPEFRFGNPVHPLMNSQAIGNVLPTKSIFGPSVVYAVSRLDEWLNPIKAVRGLNIEDAAFHYDLKNWVVGIPKSLKISNESELTRSVVYDVSSNPVEVHEFGALISKISYSNKGDVASVGDGEGARTLYEQHRLGTPQKVSFPDASTESYGVDDVGQVTSYTDGMGVINAYTFDKLGRPASSSLPGSVWSGTVIKWTHSAAGVPNIIGGPHWQMEVTRGSLIETTYLDALARPLAIRSCSDGGVDCVTQAFRYDLAGNQTFVSYPAPGSNPGTSGVETTFDLAARPVLTREDSEHGKLDTRYSYTNRHVDVTGPKGETTRYVYNLDPQDPAAILTSVTSPSGIVQTIGRDAHGRPLQITQAGKSRSFSYGKGGKLCRVSEPERGTEFRGYDGAGRLAWSSVIDGGTQQGCGNPPDTSKTIRTYDPVGRLASIAYPDGKANARFSYDRAGNLLSASTSDTAWTYSYNALGLPTLETLTVEGRTLELAYGYDPNGSIATVTYPNGQQIDYQPNGRGFPRRAGKYVTDTKYAPDGSLTWFRYANGIEYLAERNVRNLVSHMTYAKPSGLLFSQDLGYDASGNLDGVNDLVEGEPRHRRFGFDSESRLASVKDGGGNLLQSFQYDAANNIASIGGASTRTFEYDPSNRLTAAIGVDGGRHTFRYDVRGNMVGKDATNFLVDSANRLIEVSGKESYVYDAFGRRVSKGRLGTGGSKTYYLYNQAGKLFYEVSNDRTAFETDYIYLGSRLVAKEQRREKTLPGGIWFSAATPVNGDYTVLWGRIDGDVVYELEERRDGGAWTPIHRGRETSVGRPHLGGSYQYRVRVCTAQCGEWVESISLGVIPRPIFDLPTPGGYGGLWGAYQVAWQPSVGATGYDIDETTPHGWQRIASNHPHTSIERPGNVEGSYSYRVSAVNAHGTSMGVVNFPAVTVRPPIPPPDGYFYFDNVDIGAGTYRLNWIVDAFSPPELQEQRNEEPWTTIPWGTYEMFRFYVNAPGKSSGSYRYRIRYCIFACSGWLTSQPIHISR